MTTPKHVSGTIKAEIHRLRPHYLSSTSTDQARRQMLDHFDAFADRLAAIQPDPEPATTKNYAGQVSSSGKTDLVREAITEWFGPRCPDTEPGCPVCDVWAEFDALTV